MTRAVGVDLGERRIGIAVTDSGGVLASPYTVIERSGDAEHDRRALADVVRELRADVVVVGLPLTLAGKRGSAAELAVSEASALAEMLEMPVTTFDERLTTVEAERRRRERSDRGDLRRGRGRGNTKSATRRPAPEGSRRRIDAEAAAVMLAAWLEAHPS